MDCFYAAVEVRDRPELRGKPVVVGGHPNGRGVIATANYEARKFGVRSAMSSAQALKMCKDLIFVPPNFQKYKKASLQIHEVFKKYTDTIEPLSLDEAYLDVTDCEQFDGVATYIAKKIREEIYQNTGLTCSAGIAPNKFLAKVASEWKKPNNQFTVSPNDVDKFVKKLPIENIPGVGKVTKQKFHKKGIHTCEDLQKYNLEELIYFFGSWGEHLFNVARGIDHRRVSNSRIRKSLSAETTFGNDLLEIDEAERALNKLFLEWQRRMKTSQVHDAEIKSGFVKLKFTDFQSTTKEGKVSANPKFEDFVPFLKEAWNRSNLGIRLIGLGVRFKTKPNPKKTKQLDLFTGN